MKSHYPSLYKVAMTYLAILATSERIFLKAGQIITKQRNRLSEKHLNGLLFLSSLDKEFWMQ